MSDCLINNLSSKIYTEVVIKKAMKGLDMSLPNLKIKRFDDSVSFFCDTSNIDFDTLEKEFLIFLNSCLSISLESLLLENV